MLDTIKTRLAALAPTITEILKASGCPGASIGVLHEGQVVYTQGFGYRDVARELPPDEHTTYYLSSLSKTFTASMVATLVERGKLEWTTPVSEILPENQHWDPTIRAEANMVDYLSHRTGLAPKNNVWNSEFANLTMDRSAAIPMLNYLEKVADFRTIHKYNNWGYALAEDVIVALSAEPSWYTALQKEILQPLGMTRTISTRESKLENRAEPYFALSDGSPYHLPRNGYEDGKIMAGAVGLQSSVHDLLKYYKALLEAYEDQLGRGTTTTPGSPLVQVCEMFTGRAPLLSTPSKGENTYALAWARTDLPAAMGSIGLNPTYAKMPIVGDGLKEPVTCMWHQGSCNTFLSSVFLLPETKSAVVVLTNALANNDAADWVGQYVLEAVLNNEKKTDYLELAKSSAKVSTARWPKILTDLESERVHGTKPRPAATYVGKYYNKPKTFYIDVRQAGDGLTMCFQGNSEQVYDLKHYNYDVFTWVLSREETAHRGRFPVTWRAFYKLLFQIKDGGDEVYALKWENDGAYDAGEIFTKAEGLTNGHL